MCSGDMLMKKTVVRRGSMWWSTQSPHVLNTLSYAIGRLISSYSVSPSSNDPRLFCIIITFFNPQVHYNIYTNVLCVVVVYYTTYKTLMETVFIHQM